MTDDKITILVGKRGSGMSLLATMLALRLSKEQEKPVVCNLNITQPFKYYGPEDFLKDLEEAESG